MFLVGFPLLIIPFAVYNIIAFLMPTVSFTAPITRITMMSGGEWTMSIGDILIAVTIFLLFLEMVKATRIGIRTIVDHSLSLLLFIVIGAEFLMVSRAATSTFFLLLVASFAEVLGGFAVTLRSAQRDLTVEGVERLSS